MIFKIRDNLLDTHKEITVIRVPNHLTDIEVLLDSLKELLRNVREIFININHVIVIKFHSVCGMYVDVEVRTPKGRVDVVMRVAGKLYVIELKLGRSAEADMAQINLKQYPERFSLSGLQVVKVGINFDVEKHTLGDWVIEE